MTVTASQLPPVVRDAITRIVDYNWAAEERDYAGCGPGGNSRQGHIYLALTLLGRWLGSRPGTEAAPGLSDLKTDATQLGAEIGQLIDAWDKAEEVDTNLGVDIENAGRSLTILAGQLAAVVGQADPQAAWELLQDSARLGEAVDYYEALDEHDTNASIIVNELGPGIALLERALQAHRDGIPAALLEAIADLRGSMIDGYCPEDVSRILGRVSGAAGMNLVCVWDTYDSFGPGGNSQFYIEETDGRLREIAGDLWRWLNDDPDDPAAPASPGCLAAWAGEPAGFTTADLDYDDGFRNYAHRGLGSREDDANEGQGEEDDPVAFAGEEE
jgi:hypothetical protein